MNLICFTLNLGKRTPCFPRKNLNPFHNIYNDVDYLQRFSYISNQKIKSNTIIKSIFSGSTNEENPEVLLSENFRSWLLSKNVFIYNKSTWGRPPHPCVISNETTDEGEPSGRGLLAYKNIQQNEKVIEIPENLIIQNDFKNKSFSNQIELDDYDALAIFLIQQRAAGEKSPWKPYLDVLPKETDLGLVFRWELNDVFFLKGSKIIRATLFLKEKIVNQFERVQNTVFEKNPLFFPPSLFNLQSWEWALSVLFSRAIFLQKIQKLSLVPYADLLNHNPFSTSYIDAKEIPFSDAYEIAMYTDKPYSKFDQVFATYGPKTNLELLVLYGFISERNPFDSVELRVGISENDPLFGEKKNFLEDGGKTPKMTFPIFYYQYPKELYEFLRFCIVNPIDLNESDLSSLDFEEEEDLSTERIIRKIIIFSCEKNIKDYTKISQEEKIFSLLDTKISISKNQKIAIRQRKCEKKILQRLVLNLQKSII
mmetsp:Transcript_43438/g.102588  ORF Transcript_43438/g.102588 Transcript_43438/m.102588 type:complete len:481 (+) Transcript_43438:39-1481(+)